MSEDIPDLDGVSMQQELEAISAIHSLLTPLAPEQRERVFSYLLQSLGISTLAKTPANATLPASALGPGDPTDSKRFFAFKKASSDIERVLVLAASVSANGEPYFDSARLAEERIRAAAMPFNVIEAAKSAVKKGYFAAAGEGKRQLTVLGEEVAAALPDREAVSSILAAAGTRANTSRKRR